MKLVKNIILISAVLTTLVSCDMDKYPYDSIPVDNAIQSVSDCEKLRAGMYRDLRIISQSTNSLASDFQADEFIPAEYFGNQFGSLYRWEATPSEGAFGTVWGNSYTTIAQCNLLIDGIQKLIDGENLDTDEIATVKNIQGEAYMVRAYAYATLADRYCANYDASTAANTYGVPLVTKYSPSADNSTYPGRSTLEETYQRIKEDIQNAHTNLSAPGTQSSEYLTTDALDAFEARVALLTKDYDTAISKAEALINSNRYPLINNVAAFQAMWLNDVTTEVICQLYSSKLQLAPAMGSYFLDEISHKPSFLPSADVINSYSENDIRLQTYFAIDNVVFSGNVVHPMVVFNKYPGNPDMYEGSNNYVNKPKIFRIAEQYLIAAEARFQKGGTDNESKAYNWIYTLISARDQSAIRNEVGGTALQNLIRQERERELLGEGFRLTDLKRYGEGFTRQNPQDASLSYQLGLGINVSAENPRWIWAIPQSEIEANPQIKEQQNPGY